MKILITLASEYTGNAVFGKPPFLLSILTFMKKLFSCTVLMTMLIPVVLAQNLKSAKSNTWQKEIEAIAKKEIRESGTPSLQIAIGLSNKVIFEEAYGWADIENKVPATRLSKYRTASVSKWFTATAVMMLINQGKIDPNAPIQRYCPAFPEKGSPITTYHLLSHTSGIRHYLDYPAELKAAKSAADSAAVEKRNFREMLGTYTRYTDVITPLSNFKDDNLIFKPGTGWEYSSNNYRVVGCVIAGSSGKSYQALMNELIFQPAGMVNTVEDDALAIIPHRVSGYLLTSGEPLRRAEMRDVSENVAAGGHLTTATDLIRFAQAFDNSLFFTDSTKKLMLGPVKNDSLLKQPSTWRDAIPSKEKYGYGIMLFSDTASRWIGHTGRQAGASAIVVLIPERKLSIAVMTNAKGWNGYIDFTKKIAAIINTSFKD
jgi:serine beta-lactamase-like protein LACTB, mitochondrial